MVPALVFRYRADRRRITMKTAAGFEVALIACCLALSAAARAQPSDRRFAGLLRRSRSALLVGALVLTVHLVWPALAAIVPASGTEPDGMPGTIPPLLVPAFVVPGCLIATPASR
jgi:hypothetical protein